jgi:hypothetical protein
VTHGKNVIVASEKGLFTCCMEVYAMLVYLRYRVKRESQALTKYRSCSIISTIFFSIKMETLHTVGSVASIFAVGLALASGSLTMQRLLIGLVVSALIILAIYLCDMSFVSSDNQANFCPYHQGNCPYLRGRCPYSRPSE